MSSKSELPVDASTAAILRSLGAEEDSYVDALVLVRHEGTTVTRAARETGVSASKLRRVVNLVEAEGDPRRAQKAASDMLLDRCRDLSLLAAERLAERIETEGDQMRTTELAKIQKSNADLVATHDRWGSGGLSGSKETGVAALIRLLEESEIQIAKRDPAKDAIDVSPSTTRPAEDPA